MSSSLLAGILYLLFALTAINTVYHFATQKLEEHRANESHKRYEIVKETSLKYKSLVEYNAKWSFNNVPIELVYTIPYASKREVETADSDSLLGSAIREHYDEIINALQELNEQKKQYQLYLDQMRLALWVTPESFIEKTGIKESEYKRIEELLCDKETIKIKAELIITIKKTYKSSEQKTGY